MRTRTALATTLVGLLAVGSATPSFAAKPKPKPKPIHGGFTATATPDPTSDTPNGSAKCDPKTPTARVIQVFTVPAAGTLHVAVNNKLDWSADLRDASGVIADSDGDLPNTPESLDGFFKKKTKVTIGVCNFSGEPQVNVTYTFTYK